MWETLKRGLLNYDTTITGFLAVLFAALSKSYPDWEPMFTKISEGFAVLFAILAKSAMTGSPPGSTE